MLRRSLNPEMSEAIEPIKASRMGSKRLIGLALLAMAFAGLSYMCWPRHASLRRFDPNRVARLETDMWRHYYQKEYFDLFKCLYAVSREQYEFSPWDSLRLSYFAAEAAKVFQPSQNRREAEEAIPILENYYAVLRHYGGERFDVSKAARLELDWWQLRREKAAPAQYGAVIAQVTAELYATNSIAMQQSALLRAEMMHYRDEHSSNVMQIEDWDHIERGLRNAYQLLKSQVGE